MSFFTKHQRILENAIKAIHERTFYVQYPEHPGAYGEDAAKLGHKAFEAHLDQPFDQLLQGLSSSAAGEEVSPFTGRRLNITYPVYSVETLIVNAESVRAQWKNADPGVRAGLLVEALERIKERFAEIAFATMHTSGQSYMMAFQASGPHASDRALEAVAMGYYEQTRFPSKVTWEKPLGKVTVKLEKVFKPVPKGISLVIGCSTFPTWNSVPGMFASLVTGNPVIVKPHPGAVLPVAIVIAELQRTFKENGFDPCIVQLAADSSSNPVTKKLAEHNAIRLIDYTGSTSFGDYIESLKGKTVFTEKAGVNSVIIDSAKDLNAVFQNLAFAVSLYSGQMCTAPQNFFIPASGVKDGDEVIPYNEVVERFKKAVTDLVNHPKMGAGTLAALQNEATLKRVIAAEEIGGKVVLEPASVANSEFPGARTSSPALIELEAANKDVYSKELFGPVALIIKTKDTGESIALAKEMAMEHGAITCAAYTTDASIENKIYEEMEQAFTPVSMNLTGLIWVNQHATFSDFHVTGGNPAGNASFTNPEYVIKRFVWVGHRRILDPS
jgi:phenylacetic acid degradation protein paaN